MASNGGRTGAKWRAARAATIHTARQHPNGPHCGLCGKPINLDAPSRQPNGQPNPQSVTVDHITPLKKGGQLYALNNLQIAHSRCNSQQGAQLSNERQQRRQRHSRTW